MTQEDMLHNRMGHGKYYRVVDGQTRLVTQPCYWIYGIKEGRLVVIGYKNSEQEAYEFGYSKMGDVDFKVKMLPTSNMDTAVRMIKAELLDKTADLDMAIKRARRQMP